MGIAGSWGGRLMADDENRDRQQRDRGGDRGDGGGDRGRPPNRGNRPPGRGGRSGGSGSRDYRSGPPSGGSRPPQRGGYGAKPSGPRRDYDRPSGPRRDYDRPRDFDRPRDRDDRARSYDDRPRGDRPRDDRARRDDDRPRRDDDRPRRDDDRSRSYDDRPRSYDDRPRREYNDRPRRDYGDRPRTGYQGRPRPDSSDRPRPRRDDDRPARYDDRPARDDRARSDDRPRERAWEDRPRRGAPPDRPNRDWQPRGGRPVGRPYTSRPFSERGPRPPRQRDDVAVESGEFLGADEELIAGRRPVEEAFAARREAIRLLVVPERRAALDQLVIHATTLRIPVVELEGGSLTSLAGFDGHQGIALVAKPRLAADLEQILAVARARNQPPFVLVLDSLEDPQNFGTMLRSAEAVGVHGVFYPTRRSAPLSPSAIKASAGATEHLLLAAEEDLAATLADLHGRGLRIVAAEEDAAMDYSEADLRGPLALVVGSEGRGISAAVRRRIDMSVRIPMRGKIASLNAAVAGSILLFAAAQQRPAAAVPEPESKPAVETPPPTEETKPKRTRKPKADNTVALESETKPKRSRKPKAEVATETPSVDELLPGD